VVYRTAPFSVTLNDPYPGFKVMLFFDAEYFRNGTRCRHSFNGILIGNYTRPTQQCHFEWPRVILSGLAKYSVTQSIARPLCDSWASCSVTRRNNFVGGKCAPLSALLVLCCHLVVVIFGCTSISQVKWLVRKSGLLHQSTDWLGRSSPRWPIMCRVGR